MFSFYVEQFEFETYSKYIFLLPFKNGQLCHCLNFTWCSEKLKINKLSANTFFFQKTVEKWEYLFFNIYCFLFFLLHLLAHLHHWFGQGDFPIFIYLLIPSWAKFLTPFSSIYQCVYSVSIYLFVFVI